MIDFVETPLIDGMQIEEYNLLEDVGLEYWHCCVLDGTRRPISAGFSEKKSDARKIALAEYIERRQYREVGQSDENFRTSWGLDLIGTACGFAAGFNLRNTVLRSIGESLERWVMSKWIDDQFFIPKIGCESVLPGLDPASLWFYNQFDSVLFFEKEVVVQFGEEFLRFSIAQTIAFKGDGVFPGSSSQFGSGNIWQHALVESFRHLLLVKNNSVLDKFPDNKVRFFSKNADIAKLQIEKANVNDWPMPEIVFHRWVSFENEKYYLARTIIGGWKSWNTGKIDRFLY